MFDFNDEELLRYSRNILLKEIGIEGQDRICTGKVLIIGAGGLGSPIALYLAAAGIGTIGIADSDKVDLSNLQRQIIHSTPDIGIDKVESAKRKILTLNPEVEVRTYPCYIDDTNILDIIKDYDFIIDATDNFQTKYLINDACVIAGKPFSHGGIVHFEGQTMTHLPGTACFRCVFGDEPGDDDYVPTCADAGILGSVAGILGTIQATEALKYIAGTGNLLTDKLLIADTLSMTFTKVATAKNCDCPVCGTHPSITKPKHYTLKTCKLKNGNE